MDIKPLSIDLIRQDPKKSDCLKCCALMVFKYFGVDISKSDLWKSVHVYKKHSGLRGAYFQDLGVYAIKKGFEPTIYHYDWSWWNQDIVNALSSSKKALISELRSFKKEKEDWSVRKNLNKDIKYVKAGGRFVFKPPLLSEIDNILINRIPIIIFVDSKQFYHQPNLDGLHSYHSIIVTGKKDNNYFLKDPLFAVEKISSNELYYSFLKTGAWMMTLTPGVSLKKEKTNVKQTKLRF